MPPDTLILIAASNEADRLGQTIAALAVAFPGAPVWVADDGSTDATAELARGAGATVVRCGVVIGKSHGKGQAMTLAAETALSNILDSAAEAALSNILDSADGNARVRACARVPGDLEDGLSDLSGSPEAAGPRAAGTPAVDPILVLCDGDLGASARALAPLVDAVERGEADLAVAAFSTRAGGGFGLALTFARWAIRRRCGLFTRAPISGQRAMRASVLHDVLPFAPGYAMEMGMTIDAVRAGRRLLEIDLPLSHRSSGRTLAGFAHRGRQLFDFLRVYWTRR